MAWKHILAVGLCLISNDLVAAVPFGGASVARSSISIPSPSLVSVGGTGGSESLGTSNPNSTPSPSSVSVGATGGAGSIDTGSVISKGSFVFPQESCDKIQRDRIMEEIDFVGEMAQIASDNLQEGDYYSHFFAESLRAQDGFSDDIVEIFDLINNVVQGNAGLSITVTCNAGTRGCKKGNMAHMNDGQKLMNLCERFFTSTDISHTQGLLDKCDDPDIFDLRTAQRSRSSIILHEITHLSYAMGGRGQSQDYAYGFDGCTRLPAGTFDRSCVQYGDWVNKPLCPDPNNEKSESICSADKSAMNADTFAFVAAGIFFTDRCGKDIPMPAIPVSVASSFCPYVDDYLVVDLGPDDQASSSLAITGYVQFGDSYASGMGTGATSSDSCRVGANNYGALLNNWFNQDSISYERRSCSGDTIDGLNKQIDAWSNSGTAEIGTLTMGGNDVGFSDIAAWCVLTPNPFHLGGTNRQNCKDVEEGARRYMRDTSDHGLRAKLKGAYLRILEKSSVPGFQLYVTGYPPFFNQETTDCDWTSFNYFKTMYDPNWDPFGRVIYLTQSLREELNELVAELNEVIISAVLDANTAFGGNWVHFVDVADRYENHRWCEEGTHEPDSTNPNTWFFLSGWPDVSNDPATAATTITAGALAEAAERAQFFQQGSIGLPNAAACRDNLGPNPDPYVAAMCRVAETIADDPEGPEAMRFQAAEAAVTAQNFTSESVSWYLPTRQIKTFHPRTSGMYAYRDAIVEALQSNGQL